MPRVCAVLVTCNRRLLLRKALLAVAAQTRPVDRVLVIDNASTDGTAEMLARDFPHVAAIRLSENIGGAGGFTEGIRRATEDGFDWIWTLDDDSIAEPDALAQLFAAHDRFPPLIAPKLLASKIVWTDGSLHPMNIPKPKLYDAPGQFLAAEHATMSIRFTSFISMLAHRSLVEKHGLPIAGYFAWNDDVEWTARVLRNKCGVLVPASVVCHETPVKHVPATTVGGKYYYEVRNKLWILRLSNAFDRGEKWWMAKSLVRRTWRHLADARFAWVNLRGVLRGIRDGTCSLPKTAGVVRNSDTNQIREAA